MKLTPSWLPLTLLFFLPFTTHAQGVGLVLSGGGAAGFAHIGVIKALEENGIPIDYITGTSSGALVGSMYACGYSPEEIEKYVLSYQFQLMTSGKVGRQKEFLLREAETNAGAIGFSFSTGSNFRKSLSPNIIRIRPQLLDYEMMRLMGMTSAARYHDFDSLFVPFRCVASDIGAKKSVVFENGYLNEAVRASMTYPFFINSIRINGVLYLDGGLYNNFPADVMYEHFSPDFIIGSNVSYNAPPPTEDDLISQLTNLVVSPSNFSIPCEEGILIEPETSVETFDFANVQNAINDGYRSTMAKMDSIKRAVPSRTSKEVLEQRRAAFRQTVPKLVISEVNTQNEIGEDVSYVRKSILKNAKNQSISETQFERRYFRTYATPQIQFLYPTLDLKTDSTYSLGINVRKAKNFRLEIGGLLSSRAVNTGFFQINYFRLGKYAINARLNSYFGKFYSSGKAAIDIHLPLYYPLSFSAYMVQNHWDYFKSLASFVEDIKPSFLVQNETYYGAQFKQPILNNSISTLDFRYVALEDSYYQTEQWTSKDTADLTRFNGNVMSWTVEQNSLNRKQFASEGNLFMVRMRYVNGVEHSTSGSTSVEKYSFLNHHSWINFTGEARIFPIKSTHFKLGMHALANVTSQSLFKNYTATILSMPAFQPIPDMQTYFLPEYRSPQFIGGGLNFIFTFWKNFDIRLDAYLYQPFKQLVLINGSAFGYSKLFKGDTQAASLSGIYHSPFGPARISVNYFPQQFKSPLTIQISYGYVLFNERAIR